MWGKICKTHQDCRLRTPGAVALRQFLVRKEDGDWRCAIMLEEVFPDKGPFPRAEQRHIANNEGM